jgi:hypothetical protein
MFPVRSPIMRPRATGHPLGGLSTILLIVMRRAASGRADVIASGVQFPEETIFAGAELYFVGYTASDALRLDGVTVRKVSRLGGCGANGLLGLDGSLRVACFVPGKIPHVSLDGKGLTSIPIR